MQCFAIIPFREEYRAVYQQIENAINNFNIYGGTESIEICRADISDPLSINSLEEHLTEHINNSDFVICEISDLNPNIMFEMGYAVGKEKPVIIMKQQGITMPADFRGRYYFQYDLEEINIIPQMLQSFIRSAVDAVQVAHQSRNFFVQASENRGISDFRQCMNSISKLGDFLTTDPSYLAASGCVMTLREQIENNENLNIRFLILDPESEFAGIRADQLGLSRREFRHQLRHGIEDISRTMNNFPNQCQINLYSDLPMQVTYRIDEQIYYSIVSASRRGRNNLIFKLDLTHPGVHESVISHFDNVWSRSRIFHRRFDEFTE